MISMTPTYLLYFVPVLLAVSLVISATRYEQQGLILRHWVSNIIWTMVFLIVVAIAMQIVLWLI
jgi:hypothetical protein